MNLHGRVWAKTSSGCGMLCLVFMAGLGAADTPSPAPTARRVGPEEVLSPRQWEQVDRSVDRGLRWLAGNQLADGSFRSIAPGQPGVTALCVMAFLASGHRPGEGPYGHAIDTGIDFVLSCQKPNGLISYRVPEARMVPFQASHAALYNHAIAGLLLGEVYGMTDEVRAMRIRSVIEKALMLSRAHQIKRKGRAVDQGAWRYYHPWANEESDLSITAWQVMFYRSAKNAGFHVPRQHIDEAIQFVQRCFDDRLGTFRYVIMRRPYVGRAMAGCGILSLSLAGRHDTQMARRAGDWLLRNPLGRYNTTKFSEERYHYGVYYCAQGMFQLGGGYWSGFFPNLVRTLLANQGPDGSWQPESAHSDSNFGNAYTTALVVLGLTTPYQLLPIYQR